MRVLHVCSEFFPLLKTGGLADVIGALPQAQIMVGMDTRVLIPAFPTVCRGIPDAQVLTELTTFAGPARLLFGQCNNVGIYLIDVPDLYCRPGSPYHDESQFEYIDNYIRFALLGWMACELACGLDSYWSPSIIHAHDWHAGLTCAYLEARGRPVKSVFTVHNLAYQGLFSVHYMEQIQLPWSFFDMYGLEFFGQVSYLKAGLFYADHVTAVSPTYTKEITTPEYGHGMETLLAQRMCEGRLSGVLNGVDPAIWDPAHDVLLNSRYNRDTLDEKAENKRQLQIVMGLKVDEKIPVFAVISRLTKQKGLDLVLGVLPSLLEQGGQLVLLGQGDVELQQGFLAAASRHQGYVGVKIGYDEQLSHCILGGSDVIMIPSRFEPCGLTQLYGLKYGTLPLVRRTGGLADTVYDCSLQNLANGIATGFSFEYSNAWSLMQAIQRAFFLWWRPSLWRYVQRQAMKMDFSWHVTAQAYRDLYQRLL